MTNKYYFLEWLKEVYPEIKLTQTQELMLEQIFNFNKAKVNYGRQTGKTFVIDLISEYYESLLDKTRLK